MEKSLILNGYSMAALLIGIISYNHAPFPHELL